jgi:nitrite reductase/ring-hydroxylating ferredoxin subunit
MKEIDLGPIESYKEYPAKITLDETPYWLVHTSGGEYRLLMAICPHAGGEIRPVDDIFLCPLHWWTFDAETGSCTNVTDECLMQRTIEVRGGHLFAVGEDR